MIPIPLDIVRKVFHFHEFEYIQFVTLILIAIFTSCVYLSVWVKVVAQVLAYAMVAISRSFLCSFLVRLSPSQKGG